MSAALLQAGQPRPPALSQSLTNLVELWREHYPRTDRLPLVIPESARDEAFTAARQQERFCQTPSESRIVQWLAPLAAAVVNPPVGNDFDMRARVIAAVCRELPAVVFNAETQREACATFKFWPSASEVLALLSRHGQPLRDTLHVLQSLSRWQVPQRDPDPPPTPEQIAAVRIQAQQVVAELRSMSKPDPRANPKVSHFGPHLLRDVYKRQLAIGGTAADLARARLVSLPPHEQQRQEWDDAE